MKEIPLNIKEVNQLFKKLNIEKRYYKFSHQPHLMIYQDGEIKSFERFYNTLLELSEIFNDLTVRDVKIIRFNELVKKSQRAINDYLKYVPEEFKNKFDFDVENLEEKISYLRKEFVKDLS